ncbi:MAG: stage V sporulation protein AD [Clostridia bacterium]|nr:stage V sporulation protein AD [Clostridia bacterium]
MRTGRQTFGFEKVFLKTGAAIVGEKEGRGPLKSEFDQILSDDKWDEDSFEKAERKMFRAALETAKRKAGWENEDIDVVIGGDLLNQIVSASFAVRDLSVPFLGVYGACSTICESLLLAGCLIDGGFARRVLCAASSHFSTAERQYRFPLEYGSQMTPTAQWTVTGAGCSALSREESSIRLVGGTVGKIVDFGIKDAANMGAAMAPAAADTIDTYLRETGKTPEDFDRILTGDLGVLGSELFLELMKKRGWKLDNVHQDCGCLIFHPAQTAPMGASGCGCAPVVFNGAIRHAMEAGTVRHVLLAATGAMLSPTTSFQGENIPGICYAVHFARC